MNKSLWQRIQPHAIAIGVFFLVSVIYCLPALRGLVVSQHDLTGWKGIAQQSMEFKEKYGHYPLWTNSMFSGMPAFQVMVSPTYNITIAYLHYLFMFFLPQPAGLFFLACIGFYILCLSLKVKSRYAILGSLAYAFCSYNAVIVTVGHTTKFSSMGYMPAVLAGLIILYQKKYLLGFITTLVFATQLFYQNHIQIAYYTMLIAVCMVIVYAIHAIRNKEMVHFFKASGLAIVAGVMGLLSYAVVIFPTYDYGRETMRGGRSELTRPGDASDKSEGGLDKSYAFGYSYGISEVLTAVVPRLYGGSSGELPNDSKTAEVAAEKTGMGADQAEQFAKNLPAYWGPQGGTAGAVYFGAIICALFILGLVFYKGIDMRWIVAATILGVLLAWGKNFETFNFFLFDHLPFYNKFRAPSIAMVIPQLTLPLMAALGLNMFFEENTDREEFRKKFTLACIVTGILIALMAVLYFTLDYKSDSDNEIRTQLASSMSQQLSQGSQPSPDVQQRADDFGRSVVNALKEDRRSLYGSDLVRSIIFIALGLGVLYGYWKKKVNKNIATIVLTALVFIDLIGVDLRYLNNEHYVEPEVYDDAFTPTQADLQIKQDTSYYRVFNNSDGDPFQLSGATPRTSYFHNSIGGYHAAKLALYNDLIFNQLTKGNMQVFDMLNTKYFITANPADRQPMVQQNPGALGPAWFVKAIKYVDNANEEMKALDHFIAADTAIMDKREKSKVTVTPQRDSSATIVLTDHLNDEMKYASSSNVAGFAVFSEVYYPYGWKAYIDDKEVPIAKVDYLLRGLSVPAGKHAIVFKFAPRSYTIGNMLSMTIGTISILILLYGLFVLYKNYRKMQDNMAVTKK